jgi:acetyl-CoA carboxylase biotin carboxylase subunit
VPAGPGIRDDSGVESNSEVSIHYDPLISKLAAWGRTRTEAIDRLRRALDEYAVGGIKTTLPFFREIMRDEEFVAGKLDTGFISGFLARRNAVQRVSSMETETVSQDIAIIAAALEHARRQNFTPATAHGPDSSSWRMAGRVALLKTRNWRGR